MRRSWFDVLMPMIVIESLLRSLWRRLKEEKRPNRVGIGVGVALHVLLELLRAGEVLWLFRS